MDYKIAFDINGNDNGIEAGIKASVEFLNLNPNFCIVLIGPKDKIEGYFTGSKKPENLQVIDNSNEPSDVKNIRQSMHENTSMNQAINLVVNKEADAVLSSGDSGTYLAAATFKLKRLEGISRAAFMPMMPTIIGRKFLLLDVGANLDTKANYLVEWAKIASVFAKSLLNTATPRVSLINIGTEEYKGIDIIKEANEVLKKETNINYVGFQEPRDLLNGTCEVAVVDGYGGNLILKSLEGAMLSFKALLKSKIMLKTIRKLGYLLAKGAFVDTAETLDYRNVGAAWVVGVNGVAIKSHGSSDSKAYLGALNQIKLALEKNVLNEVKKSLGIEE